MDMIRVESMRSQLKCGMVYGPCDGRHSDSWLNRLDYITDVAQERATSKRVWLRNLGCRNGSVTGVGSCFTPVETRPRSQKLSTKHHMTVNSAVSINSKQLSMTDEINFIIDDSLELRKYTTDTGLRLIRLIESMSQL